MPKSKVRKNHTSKVAKRNKKIVDDKSRVIKAIEQWKASNDITPLQAQLQKRLAPIMSADLKVNDEQNNK